MISKDKFAIVLFGAPGSGKTTIGEKLTSEIKNSIFISVGSVMRDELGMIPPYLNSDRVKVMDYIKNKFNKADVNLLIIDCNPFPDEMWNAFSDTMSSFKKIYLLIQAPDKILINRMNTRGRIDSKSFTNEQRLNYFYENVHKKIERFKEKNKIYIFNNIKETDINYIVNETKIIYKELTNTNH